MLNLNFTHGAQFATQEDIDRAIEAADDIFRQYGADPQAAYVAYRAQRDSDVDVLTGLADVWACAELAADLALTEGWPNPDGAAVYLSV